MPGSDPLPAMPIIPLKEWIVDKFSDPVLKLVRKIMGWGSAQD